LFHWTRALKESILVRWFSTYYIFLLVFKGEDICTTLRRRAIGELFRPVTQWVQMNFIFNDNVRILCLSCNVKKVGKLVRFKQKGLAILPVSKARTNKFYIYRQCTYIVYILILLFCLNKGNYYYYYN
jgi:hypothetical protein